MILESSVDRLWHMIMSFKIERHRILCDHPLGDSAYSLECTFFRLIYLAANDLHRMTMQVILVGANEPEKRTLKRVQQRIPG